jgi:hypothetical protein
MPNRSGATIQTCSNNNPYVRTGCDYQMVAVAAPIGGSLRSGRVDPGFIT